MIDRDEVYTNEVLLHRKHEEQKVSKKSKHKHIYEPCVYEFLRERWDKRVHGLTKQKDVSLGTYCTVCGKVGKVEVIVWNFRDLTDDELRQLNPDTRTLPTFWLDDVWKQKYVEVEK